MTSFGTASIKQQLLKAKKDKLHLGCGTKILEGYVNIDIFPALGVDLVCDINNGIPFEDNSFAEALWKKVGSNIYSSTCGVNTHTIFKPYEQPNFPSF